MDVQSSEHLERLRDVPEVKAALLRESPDANASEARFERSAKNRLYWPPIDELAARFAAGGSSEELCLELQVYARPCRLLATALALSHPSPYVIAVVAADGSSVDDLRERLRSACRDYWHGSYFFK